MLMLPMPSVRRAPRLPSARVATVMVLPASQALPQSTTATALLPLVCLQPLRPVAAIHRTVHRSVPRPARSTVRRAVQQILPWQAVQAATPPQQAVSLDRRRIAVFSTAGTHSCPAAPAQAMPQLLLPQHMAMLAAMQLRLQSERLCMTPSCAIKQQCAQQRAQHTSLQPPTWQRRKHLRCVRPMRCAAGSAAPQAATIS